MVADERDIPGVVAPPPLIYAAGLLLGSGLQRLWPRPWLPVGWARPLGAGLLLAGLVGLAGVLAFRRAGTTPNPWRPTTRLVTGGRTASRVIAREEAYLQRRFGREYEEYRAHVRRWP